MLNALSVSLVIPSTTGIDYIWCIYRLSQISFGIFTLLSLPDLGLPNNLCSYVHMNFLARLAEIA